MRKGVFFTMDAVLAFYLALIFMSTFMFLIESSQNYTDDALSLQRLSRDICEVRQYDETSNLPDFISPESECDNADSMGSALIFICADIEEEDWQLQSEISTYSSGVWCING
jgi:hypothetical protein